jgi:hypothetical protein
MYYQGDYYRGDYYRGDPGIFSFIGKGIKAVAGALGGVVRKTPVGAAVSTALALLPKQKAFITPLSNGGLPDFGPPGPGVPMGRVLVGGMEAGIPLRPDLMGMCTVKGRKLNTSTYVTRGGGTSAWPQQILVHPKGTECVKIRRMNVANPRALRRALRRAQGFSKLARRFIVVSKKFKSTKKRR